MVSIIILCCMGIESDNYDLNTKSSLEHKTLGALHGISYMLQQLHAERGQLKGWGQGETGVTVIQDGSTAHSSKNPSVLY